MPREYFKKWYEKNKTRLADKRKKVYSTNVEYRQRALDRSSEQRAKIRQAHPAGYEVVFPAAAEILNIPLATLREWRRKKYFPEPKHHQSKMWFTPNQIRLLRVLDNFFTRSGPRPQVAEQWRLDALVDWVHSNW
jgi:hypothetical protein